ncbi:hypothetical protein MHU86_8443 [Fragilaria crotonensis]|nr:hypothetical protein MHU86_8443 [Fragilaria crotonensis]
MAPTPSRFLLQNVAYPVSRGPRQSQQIRTCRWTAPHTPNSERPVYFYPNHIWLGRNEALHSDQDEIDNKVYSVESAALRHYHGNPTLLSRSDQHYCDMPLQRLLKSGPSVRRRWLRRVRQARASFLKNGQQQQRITQFMEKTRPRVPLPPAPDIVSRPGLTRTSSTQQRMTAYFPGRPPDLATAPINPSPTLRN